MRSKFTPRWPLEAISTSLPPRAGLLTASRNACPCVPEPSVRQAQSGRAAESRAAPGMVLSQIGRRGLSPALLCHP
jgi:hypothetical protein